MTRTSFRSLLILLPLVGLACLSLASANAQVHDNSIARKFDEFIVDYYKPVRGSELDVEGHLRRFAHQLKREPRAQAYVIAYSPRVRNRLGSDYWSIAENRLLTTKAQLTDAYGINQKRFTGVDGGIRENTSVELWILPPGAKPPQPHPEFTSVDIIQCCVIQARGELYQYNKSEPLGFKASIGVGLCPEITAFHWSVSSGRISSGQGTDTITVDVTEITDRFVRATVEAEGLAHDCISGDSATTAVGVSPYKLSEFEETYSEALKIWGDYLAQYLQKEPRLRGYIIVYAGRDGRRKYALSRAAYARDYLINARGVAPDRFSIVFGGYRENLMFEYWLVPVGMSLPPASPWVDERYVHVYPRSNTANRGR